MERSNKNTLSTFNVEEARGWVIDQMNILEQIINLRIVDHFNPEKQQEFENIILNSAIIDMGGKCKILQNIPGVEEKTIQKIRKISSIRNSFAHASINQKIRTESKKSEKEDEEIIHLIPTSEFYIEVMNAKGKLESKLAFDHLVDFYNLYYEVVDEL